MSKSETETPRLSLDPPRRFVLVESGEVRAPQRGEYYVDLTGKPQLASVNFSSWCEYSILRLEDEADMRRLHTEINRLRLSRHEIMLDASGELWLYLTGTTSKAAINLSYTEDGPITREAIRQVAALLKESNDGK